MSKKAGIPLKISKTTLFSVFMIICWLGISATTANVAAEPTELPYSSEIVRQEMQGLVNEGLEQLVPELAESNTFYPFAIILGHDGIMRIMGATVENRQPLVTNVVTDLVAEAKQLAKSRRIKAVAFFMDYVALREDTGLKQPGIRIELNHQLSEALSVFVPYRHAADGKLQLLTTQYSRGKNIVFTTAGTTGVKGLKTTQE